MKKVYSFFIAVSMTVICSAQAPQKLSYQAVIRNASDQLVTNHAIGMRISILQNSALGTPVYVETQIPTTNANGLATIEIGGGTLVTGTFVGIDWSTGSYFIKTETDPTGGTSYTVTGTSQILSVPYALYAKTSGTSTDAVKISGDQTVAGNKIFSGITSVITPISAMDATNKAYVDEIKQMVQDLEDIVFTQLPLPTNGLVANYPLNGNANDASGNGNNGTLTGVATLITDRNGVSNGAYSFSNPASGAANCINATLSTPLNTSLCDGLTISAWCTLKSLTQISTLISLWDAGNVYYYSLLFDGSTKHQFVGGNAMQNGPDNMSINGLNTPNLNTWYHVLLSCNYSDNKSKLFINGVLQGESSNTLNRITISNIKIGSMYNNNGFWYINGNLDDIRIYNRALSNIESQQLYHEGGFPKKIVFDIEGNSYQTVKIGSQVWMAENLKSTKYNDNTTIPLVPDNTAWSTLSTPGYCWYNNDEAVNKSIYGAMYNWYAVSSGNLCPTGWHVPTNTEWTTLITYLGGEDIAGGKLKETGTAHWLSPNTGTNESGFTGLPGGYRVYAGNFNVIGDFGCWWTSTEIDGPSANYVSLRYFANYVNRFGNGKEGGFSVRCLRDN